MSETVKNTAGETGDTRAVWMLVAATALMLAVHLLPTPAPLERNGELIVLTPDGERLLVAESQTNRILIYDVVSPGKVGPRRVFAQLPSKDEKAGQIDNQPDGICLDAVGNLYVAHFGMRQVQVLSPTGKLIARYGGGNLTTSNVAFGGPNMDQLYVTGGLGPFKGQGGLFRLDLGVKGLVILPAKQK